MLAAVCILHLDSGGGGGGGQLACALQQQANGCDGAECGQHASCQLDHERQPVCVCDQGYLVPSEGPLVCTDVNECLAGLTITVGGQPTNGTRACGESAICINKAGSYECRCPPGYRGNPRESCRLVERKRFGSARQQQQLSAQPTKPPATSTTPTPTTSTTTSTTARPQQHQLHRLQRLRTAAAAAAAPQPTVRKQQPEPTATSRAPPQVQQQIEQQHEIIHHQQVDIGGHLQQQYQQPIPASIIEQQVRASHHELQQQKQQDSVELQIHQQQQEQRRQQAVAVAQPADVVFEIGPVQVDVHKQRQSASQITRTTITEEHHEQHHEQHQQHQEIRRQQIVAAPPPPVRAQVELVQVAQLVQQPAELVQQKQQTATIVETTSEQLDQNRQQQQQQVVVVTPPPPPAQILQVIELAPQVNLLQKKKVVTESEELNQRQQQQQQQQRDQRQQVVVIPAPPRQVVEIVQQPPAAQLIEEKQKKITTTVVVADEQNQNQNQNRSQSNSTLIKYECLRDADCPPDQYCNLEMHKCRSPCFVCGPQAACRVELHVAICSCPPKYVGSAIDLVYGCQPPPSTTTTTTTTTTTSTTTTTTTPAPPPETTTPEVRTIPASDLSVLCQADGIKVETQLDGGFDGIMYVKSHSQSPKCRKLLNPSSLGDSSAGGNGLQVEFRVPFGECGLVANKETGEAKFVLVIQKHPKLVTYRARAYNVNCFYETSTREVDVGLNVTALMKSGTIANTGPPPSLVMSITSVNGSEITRAEVGQDLLLRVEVQPDNIYGGFARSCEAQTQSSDEPDATGGELIAVTDSRGCAIDPAIFTNWQEEPNSKTLVAKFNAFKFPSSNALSFQCHMRVCFGKCPTVNCNGIDALAKERRQRRQAEVEGAPRSTTSTTTTRKPAGGRFEAEAEGDGDGDEDDLLVRDAFKEGTLKEDIVIKSNTILTFEPKNAPLLEQEPQVEEIEFVCMPWFGVILSILLTLLLASIALCLALSCWRAAAAAPRRPAPTGDATNCESPLPHPREFPNPLLAANPKYR